MTTAARITVIGVGNPYRHDDAAGLVVLERLRERFGQDRRVRLLELDGEPVSVIQAWEGSDTVLIIDAVRSTRAAGTIVELSRAEVVSAATNGVTLGGGHLLGVSEAVELARVLAKLPSVLGVVGIEGADFGLGQGLSERVAQACERVVEQLTARIERLLAMTPVPDSGAVTTSGRPHLG